MSHLAAYVLLCIVLIGAAVTDCRTGQIYNRWTYPAMLAGVLLATITGLVHDGWSGAGAGLGYSVLGLLAGLVPFALISIAGLGGGDVKLMGAVGAITADWHMVLGVSFYAFAFALLIAIIVMIRRRVVLQTFHRIFIAGLMASHRVKPQLPEKTIRIPFGLAICLGGVLLGAQVWMGLNLPFSPMI